MLTPDEMEAKLNDEAVEAYIRQLSWTPSTTNYEKTLVGGNIRGFWNSLPWHEIVARVRELEANAAAARTALGLGQPHIPLATLVATAVEAHDLIAAQLRADLLEMAQLVTCAGCTDNGTCSPDCVGEKAARIVEDLAR